jgi:hypothetical protein
MGDVILSALVSLDGRINGPDGGIDWHIELEHEVEVTDEYVRLSLRHLPRRS